MGRKAFLLAYVASTRLWKTLNVALKYTAYALLSAWMLWNRHRHGRDALDFDFGSHLDISPLKAKCCYQ
jgi:hypothetical protein